MEMTLNNLSELAAKATHFDETVAVLNEWLHEHRNIVIVPHRHPIWWVMVTDRPGNEATVSAGTYSECLRFALDYRPE